MVLAFSDTHAPRLGEREAVLQCVQVLGAGCIEDATMEELLRILNKQFDKYFDNQKERAGTKICRLGSSIVFFTLVL